jgi:hypothetical protein
MASTPHLRRARAAFVMPLTAFMPLTVLALAGAALFGSCSSIDVPKSTGAPPRDAKGAFDHKEWDAIVKRYVDRNGRVDYGSLRLNTIQLDKYLGQAASTSPDNDRSLFPTRWHQIAYWVNVYNACVVKQVVAKNITDTVGESIFNQANFFKLTKYEIGGETMSLEAIEDKASTYNEPRVHFVMNSGTGGGARLRPEALTGENADKILDEAAQEFCNETRNVDIAKGSNTVTLSEVFEKHSEDFTSFASLKGVANPTIRDAINFWRPKEGKLPVNGENIFRAFDWALNKQLTAAEAASKK